MKIESHPFRKIPKFPHTYMLATSQRSERIQNIIVWTDINIKENSLIKMDKSTLKKKKKKIKHVNYVRKITRCTLQQPVVREA